MLKGLFIVLAAELCFASATLFAKWAWVTGGIGGIEVMFCRFLLGTLWAWAVLKKSGTDFKPRRPDLVVWRGLFNSTATVCFFLAVQMSTLTNANMLNMTYPVFVFLIAPFVTKEKMPRGFPIFLAMAMAGIFLVINPQFDRISLGDLLGLASGILAAFGTSTLKKARTYDSTFVILFYMMSLGTVVCLVLLPWAFTLPTGWGLFHLAVSAALGVAGQTILTYGYAFVTARTGALFSSSRIVYALVLGVVFLQEGLGWNSLAGAGLIFGAVVGVALTAYQANRKTTVET